MLQRFRPWLVVILLLSVGQMMASDVKWSIVVYAGTDEEELAQKADPLISKMLKTPLPPNTELLIQNDTWKPDGVKRIIKHADGKGNDEVVELPEHDSASIVVFEDFLNWAGANARGERKLFLVFTHSWGWKGIIQDFSIPGKPGEDTIMSIKTFSGAITKSSLRPDVIFLDSCVLGVAEVVEEMKHTTPYLVLPQRETPYCGFPFKSLCQLFTKHPEVAPVELARMIPIEYAEVYSQNGSMAKEEGECDIVTTVSVDTKRWDAFVDDFAKFTALLSKKGMRDRLKKDKTWFNKVADIDFNVDLVEFLYRVPDFMSMDAEVAAAAQGLLDKIGYPKAISDVSAEKLHIDPAKAAGFKLWIEADKNVKAEELLTKTKEKWDFNNADLKIPELVKYAIEEVSGKKYFTVSLAKLEKNMELRPWLPGVLQVTYEYTDASTKEQQKQTFKRDKDYFAVPQFPETSFMVSEAHSNGAPFIHGIGFLLKPAMNNTEKKGKDPDTGITGPAYYKAGGWNKRTHWGEMVLLEEGKTPELTDENVRLRRSSRRYRLPGE